MLFLFQFATFVIRGRLHRVARMGVRATVIDYSLSRVSLRLVAGDEAALYNDLARDESLFDAVGDYQFQVYRLMRDKLGYVSCTSSSRSQIKLGIYNAPPIMLHLVSSDRTFYLFKYHNCRPTPLRLERCVFFVCNFME